VGDQSTDCTSSTHPDGSDSQSGDLGEKWPLNFAYETFRLHAVNLRHGTDGFTSPPKEVVLGFLSPVKMHRPRYRTRELWVQWRAR
jgi:hypothetical protein